MGNPFDKIDIDAYINMMKKVKMFEGVDWDEYKQLMEAFKNEDFNYVEKAFKAQQISPELKNGIKEWISMFNLPYIPEYDSYYTFLHKILWEPDIKEYPVKGPDIPIKGSDTEENIEK